MNSRLEKIISIPKSFYVSYRLTGFRMSLKLPILVRFNTVVKSLKGRVIFDDCEPFMGILQVGFSGVGIIDEKYQRPLIEINGEIHLKGKAYFGYGAKLSIGGGGILRIGDGLLNNAGMTLICFNQISIGHNVLVSWDTTVMDTDFHQQYDLIKGIVKATTGEISIGNNCWICYGATVLKNTHIADGVIVSAKSLVKGTHDEDNSVIGGVPAKTIKHNVTLYRPSTGS